MPLEHWATGVPRGNDVGEQQCRRSFPFHAASNVSPSFVTSLFTTVLFLTVSQATSRNCRHGNGAGLTGLFPVPSSSLVAP